MIVERRLQVVEGAFLVVELGVGAGEVERRRVAPAGDATLELRDLYPEQRHLLDLAVPLLAPGRREDISERVVRNISLEFVAFRASRDRLVEAPLRATDFGEAEAGTRVVLMGVDRREIEI